MGSRTLGSPADGRIRVQRQRIATTDDQGQECDDFQRRTPTAGCCRLKGDGYSS